MTVTHVLREDVSPAEALVWSMWCGHQCFAFDDGTLSPETDFYLEKQAHLSDCSACKCAVGHRAAERRTVSA